MDSEIYPSLAILSVVKHGKSSLRLRVCHPPLLPCLHSCEMGVISSAKWNVALQQLCCPSHAMLTTNPTLPGLGKALPVFYLVLWFHSKVWLRSFGPALDLWGFPRGFAACPSFPLITARVIPGTQRCLNYSCASPQCCQPWLHSALLASTAEQIIYSAVCSLCYKW